MLLKSSYLDPLIIIFVASALTVVCAAPARPNSYVTSTAAATPSSRTIDGRPQASSGSASDDYAERSLLYLFAGIGADFCAVAFVLYRKCQRDKRDSPEAAFDEENPQGHGSGSRPVHDGTGNDMNNHDRSDARRNHSSQTGHSTRERSASSRPPSAPRRGGHSATDDGDGGDRRAPSRPRGRAPIVDNDGRNDARRNHSRSGTPPRVWNQSNSSSTTVYGSASPRDRPPRSLPDSGSERGVSGTGDQRHRSRRDRGRRQAEHDHRRSGSVSSTSQAPADDTYDVSPISPTDEHSGTERRDGSGATGSWPRAHHGSN